MTRGQDTEARLARWRKGNCPIHGLGLVTPPGAAPPPQPPKRTKNPMPVTSSILHCPDEECDLEVSVWPGKDAYHGLLGWKIGPQELKAILVKANEVQAEGEEPGRSARSVRIAWPLEEV